MVTMMPVRFAFLLFAFLLLAIPVQAQDDAVAIAGQRQPTQVRVQPTYEQYDDGRITVSEVSTTVAAFVPVNQQLGLTFHAGFASADSEPGSLSGLTDAQVGATFSQPLGQASVVLGMGLNLPSGARSLTPEAFQTLTIISRTPYGFQVPSLGQGFGAAPSLTFAVPVNDRFVLGAGVAFQYRGSFEPLEDMIDAYDPGDELLLTGGFDVQVSDQMTLSGDVSYTSYGTDKVGDDDVFESSDKVTATAQLRQYRGFQELWVVARYRSRGRSDIVTPQGLVPEMAKTLPNQTSLLARYRFRALPQLDLAVRAEAHFFEAVPQYKIEQVFHAGVLPTLRINPRVSLPGRLLVAFGDLSGIEAGLGLSLSL